MIRKPLAIAYHDNYYTFVDHLDKFHLPPLIKSTIVILAYSINFGVSSIIYTSITIANHNTSTRKTMCRLLLTCYKQSAINYKHQLNTSNNYKVLKSYKNHINQNIVCPHDNTRLLFPYTILPYTSSWELFMLCGKWFYNTWELWWRYDFYNELVNIYVLFSHFFAISTVTELYI
jgi:hypothetical protein